MLISEKAMKQKTAGISKAVRSPKGVFVELMTPKGKVFSGRAAAVRFSPANTVVQLEPGAVSYFGLINSGGLVLRTGNRFQFFALGVVVNESQRRWCRRARNGRRRKGNNEIGKYRTEVGRSVRSMRQIS